MRGRTLHAHDIEGHAERGSGALRPGCCAAFSIQPPEEEGEVLVLMAELRPEQANNSEAELLAVVRDVVKAVKDGEGIKPHALVLLKVPTPPQLPSTPTNPNFVARLISSANSDAECAPRGPLGPSLKPFLRCSKS